MLFAVHIFVKFLYLMISSPKRPTLIEVVWKEVLRTSVWQQERERDRQRERNEEENEQWGIS
jgi:hypothetical protein